MNTTYLTMRQNWIMSLAPEYVEAWGFVAAENGLGVYTQPVDQSPLERIAAAIERIATIMGA